MALALAPAAAAAQSAGPDEVLSNERTSSQWAFARAPEPVRPEPSASSAPIANVRMSTELGAPEVYLVLRRRTDPDGVSWLQVRVPMRPNGRIGWVRESALTPPTVTRTQLVINLRRRRATLFRSGSRVWGARIGVGKSRTPTPRGRFYVRERLSLGARGGPYGAFAFGTSAYSDRLSDWPGGGVVGIHGTNQPELIPGAVSHGCVRMSNRDILRLRRLMGLGSPIWIR